jgi:hypothetical protein
LRAPKDEKGEVDEQKSEREIQHKLRILKHAEQIGGAAKTYRYFRVARSSCYRWKDRCGRAGLLKKPPKNPAKRAASKIATKILYLCRPYHLRPIRIVWYPATRPSSSLSRPYGALIPCTSLDTSRCARAFFKVATDSAPAAVIYPIFNVTISPTNRLSITLFVPTETSGHVCSPIMLRTGRTANNLQSCGLDFFRSHC